VFATADYLYVADEHGLQIVDVSEPGDPELLVTCKPDEVFGEGVWSDDEVAYVAANHFRVHADEGHPVVQVFDVSDPYRPYRCSAPVAPIPGRAVDVDVEEERLYVAVENGGVVVYDLSNPCDPSYLGAFDTHFAQKLCVLDGIVFVADGEGGFVVVDASDPQQMHAVGQCQTVDRAFGVDVAHGYAYVADGTAGLQVVDLSSLTPTPTPTLTPTPTRTPLPTVPPNTYTHMPLVFK
jgi:hypothetical protein